MGNTPLRPLSRHHPEADLREADLRQEGNWDFNIFKRTLNLTALRAGVNFQRDLQHAPTIIQSK